MKALLAAIVNVGSTVRDDFADAFTNHLSAISWMGAIRLVVYVLAVLSLKLGFDYSNGKGMFPKKVFVSRSLAQDFGMAFTNAIILTTLGLFVTQDALQEGLTSVIQTHLGGGAGPLFAGAGDGAGSGAWWIKAVSVACVVLAVDFGAYAYHWLMHRNRILWEFHKVHHSAPTLNAATIFRVHPVDIVLRTVAVGLVLGVVTGALRLCFGAEPLAANLASGFKLYAVLMAYLAVLNHSHVWLSLGPLEYLLNSPAMHAIHHSQEPRHFDRNFASLFSIWDVLFGSFYKTTRRPEPLALGVDGTDWSSVFFPRLVVLPFQNLLRGKRAPIETGAKLTATDATTNDRGTIHDKSTFARN